MNCIVIDITNLYVGIFVTRSSKPAGSSTCYAEVTVAVLLLLPLPASSLLQLQARQLLMRRSSLCCSSVSVGVMI
jgi:hypothetical protein